MSSSRRPHRLSHFKPTTLLDRFYEVGLVIKGIDGFFEFLGGILVLVIPPSSFNSATNKLTNHALSKDPNSFWANYAAKIGADLSRGHNIFLATFFLVNGAVKLALVICLYLNQLWVYPIALVILNLFFAFEIYKFVTNPSFGLAFLAILDALIIWLIYREWKKVRSNPKNTDESTL